MNLVLAIVGSYLLGSIPCGLFWAWIMRRVDVRQVGSGRTGGTNVWRSAGFWPAFLTALSDALKGACGIWLAKALGADAWGIGLAGTAAVVGHNYSIYLKFRGGAGTMTSVGVAAALWGFNFPLLVVSGMAIALLMGHASLASILVAFMLPLIFLVRNEIPYAVGFGVLTMILTLWALRPNIVRLYHREERFLPIFQDKPPLFPWSKHSGPSKTEGKK